MKKFFFFLLFIFCLSFSNLLIYAEETKDECDDKFKTKDIKDDENQKLKDCRSAKKEIEDIQNSSAKCATGLAKLFNSDGKKYSCTRNMMGLVGSLSKLDALVIGKMYLNMKDVPKGLDGTQVLKEHVLNNCNEDQRSEYRENETEITFGVCDDNILLNILAATNPIPLIIKSIADGTYPITTIKNAIKGESPYMVYTKKVGHEDRFNSNGGSYKIELVGDKICVSIRSLLYGYVPIGCKYTSEPCPNSKYVGFFDPDTTKNPCTFVNPKDDKDSQIERKNTQQKFGSCYIDAVKNSKNIIQITSPLAYCIKANLATILTGSTDSYNISRSASLEKNSPVFRLQNGMKNFIKGLFLLYIIFFGINLALGRISASKDLIISMVKFIFVVYFSVGFDYSGKSSGITEYLFPFIIEGSTYFAGWISQDVVSELCYFNSIKDYKGGVDLSLFDSIDCKITHYLGINDIYVVSKLGSKEQIAGQLAKFGVLFIIIGICIYLGLMTIVMVIISYFVIILLIFINFFQAFVMSLICSTILAILAPIVVPLYLFERTKQYFNSWLSMLISFTLQPMVITAFFVIFSSVFDYGYYGNCKFKGINLKNDSGTVSKVFLLDKSTNYGDDNSCTTSLGYLLGPAFDLGTINSSIDYAPEDIKGIIKDEEDRKFISKKEGVFIEYGTINSVGEIVSRMLKSIFVLYICYGISSGVTDFASDMTGGVNLGAYTSKPNKGLASLEKAAKKHDKKTHSKRNAKDKRSNIKTSGKGDAKDKDSVSAGKSDSDSEKEKDSEGGSSSKITKEGSSGESESSDSRSSSESSVESKSSNKDSSSEQGGEDNSDNGSSSESKGGNDNHDHGSEA